MYITRIYATYPTYIYYPTYIFSKKVGFKEKLQRIMIKAGN